MTPSRQPLAFLARLFGDGDALDGHREKILFRIAVVSAVLLAPFGVNNLFIDRVPLGIAILVTVAVLTVDAVAIHRGRRPPVPFELLLVPVAVAVALLLRTQPMYGVLWTYPAILFSYFVLSRRLAIPVSLGLLTAATAMVYTYIDAGTALRVFASVLLTIVIVNIILGVVNDLHARLVAQAVTDPLTGAYNRRHMESCLDDVIERQRRTGASAALLLIDIDQFKPVNDRFGHAAGDDVLRTVVGLVVDRVRRLDRVFRIGGDEFLLLLPDADLGAAQKVAEDLRARIAVSAIAGTAPVTVSIGLAVLQPGQQMDAWMHAADAALYRAKQQGRNRVVAADAIDADAERASLLSAKE
jgi:diguanylate cyclase (GGDEF)-like protein